MFAIPGSLSEGAIGFGLSLGVSGGSVDVFGVFLGSFRAVGLLGIHFVGEKHFKYYFKRNSLVINKKLHLICLKELMKSRRDQII